MKHSDAMEDHRNTDCQRKSFSSEEWYATSKMHQIEQTMSFGMTKMQKTADSKQNVCFRAPVQTA